MNISFSFSMSTKISTFQNKNLLGQIIDKAKSILVVGDDDQVLYETLKSGKASLIRDIYRNTTAANAMLPFCGRCDFHITRTADYFIKQAADPDSIKKIYLPISEAGESQKVQIVACAAPSTAVEYIRKFIEDHKTDIDQRKADLAAGKAKDKGGPGCLNRFSASISGASAGVRLPSGVAAG
jgi:hypothetical protein